MAKVQMMMPEGFLARLSKLGNQSDAISEKVLEAGGEVVLAKVQSNLSSVIGRGTKYDACPDEDVFNQNRLWLQGGGYRRCFPEGFGSCGAVGAGCGS